MTVLGVRARERFCLVLATIAINVAAVIAFANVSWSDWRSGLALNLLDDALLIGWALWRRDRLMAKLVVFGVALGFAELPADAWLVDVARTLDYSIGGGPMLWRSPAWIFRCYPIGWWVTGRHG